MPPARNVSADARSGSAASWLARGSNGRPPDLAVLGVPAHASSRSGSGTHRTPAAIRAALHALSTWSGSRKIDLTTMTALDLGNVDDPDLDEGAWRVRIASESGATLARLVALIGGDSSFIGSAAAGVLGDVAAGGLVILDLRHDVLREAGNASAVRDLLDAGMPGECIVQVGIADWADSRSYADEAYARGIHPMHRAEVAERGIAECMTEALAIAGAGSRPVFVVLDLNVCDRSVAPACSGALPGGLSAREILDAAHVAAASPSVRAVAITEVDAAADPTGSTVRLAAMCLLEAAAGLAARTAD